MTIAADRTVSPADLGIDPRDNLVCGERVAPNGEIVIPVPLKGTSQAAICENPAIYVVGEPHVVAREKDVLTDELEWTTETDEDDELALLSCGVHRERAVEHWQHHERIEGTDYPPVAKFKEEQTDA